MSDILSYIIIAGVFLGGMVPLVAGIFHYQKENRRLDELAAEHIEISKKLKK